MIRPIVCFLGVAGALFLSACGSNAHRAPVYEGGGAKHSVVAEKTPRKFTKQEKDWRPRVHRVQKGETLYSIAFNYGFDYHELAELNGLKDPSVIRAGQTLNLFADSTSRPGVVVESTSAPRKAEPQTTLPAMTQASQPNRPVAMPGKEPTDKPARAESASPASGQLTASKPAVSQATPSTVAKAEATGDGQTQKNPAAKPEEPYTDEADTDLEWAMPTQGKVIADFSESANRKGIDIAGKSGQPIVASAPGKVVYSGSGLRGYGKLVIIKHNNTFLSAYAHNDKVLVKEGQTVTRGQKIAEMGNSDADQVKLHFEIRRFGKPVDPAKFLPSGKS